MNLVVERGTERGLSHTCQFQARLIRLVFDGNQPVLPLGSRVSLLSELAGRRDRLINQYAYRESGCLTALALLVPSWGLSARGVKGIAIVTQRVHSRSALPGAPIGKRRMYVKKQK
jgi:hypothetical protein